MTTVALLTQQFFLIFSFYAQMLFADCPRLCECKWKSGKESVICTNANLSNVPGDLDAGTQILDLSSNAIVNVKNDEFSKAGLLNLQKIYVARCRLKSLDRYAFRNLINLVELDLSYNFLTAVPSQVFSSIHELRELKLSGNPIQRILNSAFENVPQLIRLELSECKISVIEEYGFKGLEKYLEWLKLDKNKLSELKHISLTILENLHELELAGNPWNCSCMLRPLREWMLKQNVPFGVPPTCKFPQRLSSKPWDKLDLDEFACIPEIFPYDSKAHGIEGRNITMTCHITGIPIPNVRWLLKNKVIANLSGSPYSNGKKLYTVRLKNNSSDLTILTADLQDAGVYVCAAENKAGRAEASVTLAVSKRTPESALSNKLIVVSAVSGTLLTLASCLLIVCVCTIRKKQLGVWRRDECRGEENYEKIELNHKVSGNVNGRPAHSEISIVGATRKNGEYRVVPGGDTDQEVEEEEENVDDKNQKETRLWNPSSAGSPETKWNTPEHMLEETRDDYKKISDSTSGTYRESTSTSSLLPQSHYYPLRSKPYENTYTALHYSGFSSDLSSLAENDEKKFPDLIENSSPSNKINPISTKANSEGGSVNDITELFCTLPRKRGPAQSNNNRYTSSDSQSPLLPESRYGSSGGYSSSSQDSSRIMGDFQKFSAGNLLKSRANQKSNSFLNLTSPKPVNIQSPIQDVSNATPLLDVSKLESRVYKNSNTSAYDYHAAQLERFLEEYRTLQKELTKMKETCDNLKTDKSLLLLPKCDFSPTTSSTEDGFNKSILNNSPASMESSCSNPSISMSVSNCDGDLNNYLFSKCIHLNK
ncbi:ig(immunoglobulin) and lrr(leucine rich repeat) domain [Holotrichia oblita]|uniref:Ig(Immunoglobulin) and lrr(Leucine rich repeat) domain n=1 Tax=Holotrichia oblita TaxID=644536 RepID=A0ACB9T950_HOLOL|nr:ig(immunoglobulin) and lrr(leucine rich repeat) domain [Holotrichia oblita]